MKLEPVTFVLLYFLYLAVQNNVTTRGICF